MKIKGLIFEDMVNYKKISLTIMMPICNFKCDKECGRNVCQNSPLANSPDIDIDPESVINLYYLNNPLTDSLVFQGLEPLDTFDDLIDFIKKFREVSEDDIVIYTGYNIDEASNYVNYLQQYKNIIIKFGRFIPDQESHYDEVLGVNLASPNQYAVKIS